MGVLLALYRFCIRGISFRLVLFCVLWRSLHLRFTRRERFSVLFSMSEHLHYTHIPESKVIALVGMDWSFVVCMRGSNGAASIILYMEEIVWKSWRVGRGRSYRCISCICISNRMSRREAE